MITKDKLKELYIEKRLTTHEVAEIYNVHRKTVSRWLKKYGIDINPKQRKFELIKKIPFNNEQKQIIFGTLLGDGCISPHGRKNKSYRLILGHCEKQKEFLLWKKKILGNFVNTIRRQENKQKNSIMYSFTTVTHNEFKFYYNLFYKNNKKIIQEQMIHYLTPLAMAVWVMDDGSRYQVKNTMRISTDSFSKEENELLKHFIKINFNINAKVCEYNRNNNKFYYLSFNVRNSALLSDVIRPYIVDSMSYKLCPTRSSTTKCQTPDMIDEVINIEPSNWREEWKELRKKYLG